jgi:hypothetical protein
MPGILGGLSHFLALIGGVSGLLIDWLGFAIQ